MPAARFYFDLVDPLSFLLDRELLALEQEEPDLRIARLGVEIRPAPAPLVDAADPAWSERWRQARGIAVGFGLTLQDLPFVPWSRKAHELLLHAEASGAESDALRTRLFGALFEEGRDVGRVDVLLEVADGAGFDTSEAKAVLDVDRYAEEVREGTRRAVEAGVRAVPWLELDGRALRGFHNREDLRTFLLPAP